MIVPTINGTPVLLPAHQDIGGCLKGGEELHYHVDWRFVSKLGDVRMAVRATNNQIVMMDLPQIREVHPEHPRFIFATWEMMCKYRWAKLGENRRCPHQGICVPEQTCPGHGLMWDDEGYLKHRNCQLWFGLVDAYSKILCRIDVDWEFQKNLIFPVEREFTVAGIVFGADDDILASVRDGLDQLTVSPGDTFHYKAQC